jgi:hypothetical protein
MFQVLDCFPNVAPAAGTFLCMAHWRVREAHPQLDSLLFQLGEADSFWDMAMALGDELASFDVVVEKWDSSKIGGKRGSSKKKQGAGKRYTTAKAGTSNTRAVAEDVRAASSIWDQNAGMPACPGGSCPSRLTMALSKLVAADKGGKR